MLWETAAAYSDAYHRNSKLNVRGQSESQNEEGVVADGGQEEGAAGKGQRNG